MRTTENRYISSLPRHNFSLKGFRRTLSSFNRCFCGCGELRRFYRKRNVKFAVAQYFKSAVVLYVFRKTLFHYVFQIYYRASRYVCKVGKIYDYVMENGLAKAVKNNSGLKVLGNGELNVALTVKAAKFSAAAKAAIEAAQGTAETL